MNWTILPHVYNRVQAYLLVLGFNGNESVCLLARGVLAICNQLILVHTTKALLDDALLRRALQLHLHLLEQHAKELGRVLLNKRVCWVAFPVL